MGSEERGVESGELVARSEECFVNMFCGSGRNISLRLL